MIRVACLLVLSVCVFGCDWARAKAPEIAFDAIAAGICVLEHKDDAPGVVAADCGGLALEDVLKLLASKQKVIAAARVGACGK